MSVQFAGNELANSIYNLEIMQHESLPEREIRVVDEPYRDGKAYISSFYREKRIKFRGTLKGSSRADLDSKIDLLKQILSDKAPQNLDITYGTGIRRYLALVEEVTIARNHYDIDVVGYQGSFIILSGEGTSETFTYQDLGNIFTSNWNETLAFGGNRDPKPIIYVKVRNSNSTTAIDVRNNTTGQGIAVERTFNNGDLLAIDINSMTVTVNGSNVIYKGHFPEFEDGFNDIQVRLFIQSIIQSQSLSASGSQVDSVSNRKAQVFNLSTNALLTKFEIKFTKNDYNGDWEFSVQNTEGDCSLLGSGSIEPTPNENIFPDSVVIANLTGSSSPGASNTINWSFPYPRVIAGNCFAVVWKALGTFGATKPQFWGTTPLSVKAKEFNAGTWQNDSQVDQFYYNLYYLKTNSAAHFNLDFSYMRRYL